MSLTRKSQSALEYLMTYGWAILIIVIVAGVLYSLGIFSPSSSVGATITGFSGLGVTQAACVNSVNNQILELYVSNRVGYMVNLTKINVTGNNGITVSQNVSSILSAGQSGIFYVNGACNKSSSSYSGSATITYTEPGQTFLGPYFSTGSVSKMPVASNSNLVGNFTNTSQIQTAHGYAAPPAVTITMWVKFKHLDNSLGQYFEISGYDSKSPEATQCCQWRYGAGVTGIGFDAGYWSAWHTPSWVANYNQWHLVTMVLQNVTGSQNLYWIYLNKTLEVSGSAGSSPGLGIPQVDYLDIGAGPGSSPAVNGEISNVQVYQSALSQTQVSQLFSEGLGGAPISNAGLIGWWSLDGNANDYSGNNNNGVATNVQWVSP